MFEPLERRLRQLRNLLARNEWVVRAAGLERVLPMDSTRSERRREYQTGLIMVQIDGLSNKEIAKALENGRMPFLHRLLSSEQYQRLPMYSGLPSSTPAVQGELFYGIRGVVPAFAYYSRSREQIERMWFPDTALQIESHLQTSGESLLCKGSAYCNIYTGGADEPHFCASSMGWAEVMDSFRPKHWALVMLLNVPLFVRVVVLMAVELALAIFDFIRGQLSGRSFGPELKFIAARVMVSILLRDLCVMSAKMDMARGLPIIHLNLLGYDEQAHRRGPRSRFAHWTLKGIDNCIKSLWNTAQRVSGRQYDVWIYSDHGQESTESFQDIYGSSLKTAVQRALLTVTGKSGGHRTTSNDTGASSATSNHNKQRSPRNSPDLVVHRASWLYRKRRQTSRVQTRSSQAPVSSGNSSNIQNRAEHEVGHENFQVAAQGPVGHIYFDNSFTAVELEHLSNYLVNNCAVPACAFADQNGRAIAVSKKGRFELPTDTAKLVGNSHPYHEELENDLLRLTLHKDAGDLVLLGWCDGADAISFAEENGSHAGCGPNETDAFVVMPQDVVSNNNPQPLRPADLRGLALEHMRQALSDTETPNIEIKSFVNSREITETASNRLKVMSYNVHSCIGLDGIVAPERIARVIDRHQPDIVCLQELDIGQDRSHYRDQVKVIAGILQMNDYFVASIKHTKGYYGNAVLSRLPAKNTQSVILPTIRNAGKNEPRSAQWLSLDWNDNAIELINTHLGLDSYERKRHAEYLTRSDWIDNNRFSRYGILCGDLNSLNNSYVVKLFRSRLSGEFNNNAGVQGKRTFSSRVPIAQIDHILFGENWRAVDSTVPRDELTRVASDHLPLIVELEPINPANNTGSDESNVKLM